MTKTKVTGLENIPPEGAFILVSNHLGILDPPLIFSILDRQDATAFVAKKHQSNPFYRWLVNRVHGIWLNRNNTDTYAFRQAQQHLENGGILGISPEGTRSPTHALIRAKTGTAYLADKVRVPILPVGITGTEDAVKKLLRLRRPEITVTFGKPFTLPPVGKINRSLGLEKNTDEIMCQIAALLPPKYRGVYKNHPRLKQLLEVKDKKTKTAI